MVDNGPDVRIEPGSLVSIVMPAYRMGMFIGEALRTVAAQTHSAWEVIVVDDHAPDDGTMGIVQAFATGHPNHRVEFIRHTENQGVSAARNTAIAAANGKLVAFLDPDDRWWPHHLEKLIERFVIGEGCDVATGPVEAFWEGPGAPAPSVWPIAEWQIRSFPAALALNNFIQPSATLVRRSALVNVGGFDTDPGLQHIEDYDLWIRLVEHGCRFAFLRVPTSGYRKHAAAASSDEARMHALHDRLYAKHTAFFRAARGRLTRTLMGRVEPLHDDLGEVKIQLNGPILRSIRFVDECIRRFVRAVRQG